MLAKSLLPTCIPESNCEASFVVWCQASPMTLLVWCHPLARDCPENSIFILYKSQEWSGWLWTTVEGQGLNRQLGGHGRAPTTSSDQGPVSAGASRMLSLGLRKGMTSSTHRRSGATHCSEVSGGASGKRLARDRPPMPEAGTVDHLPPET